MGSGRRQIVWSKAAAAALDEAVAYVSQESASAALQLLEKAFTSAASLAEYAERGRIVPEIGSPTIREIFVFKYRLMYAVAESEVQVVAFLHGAR